LKESLKVILVLMGFGTGCLGLYFLFFVPFHQPLMRDIALLIGFVWTVLSSTCLQYALQSRDYLFPKEKWVGLNGILGFCIAVWSEVLFTMKPIGGGYHMPTYDSIPTAPLILLASAAIGINWPKVLAAIKNKGRS